MPDDIDLTCQVTPVRLPPADPGCLTWLTGPRAADTPPTYACECTAVWVEDWETARDIDERLTDSRRWPIFYVSPTADGRARINVTIRVDGLTAPESVVRAMAEWSLLGLPYVADWLEAAAVAQGERWAARRPGDPETVSEALAARGAVRARMVNQLRLNTLINAGEQAADTEVLDRIMRASGHSGAQLKALLGTLGQLQTDPAPPPPPPATGLRRVWLRIAGWFWFELGTVAYTCVALSRGRRTIDDPERHAILMWLDHRWFRTQTRLGRQR